MPSLDTKNSYIIQGCNVLDAEKSIKFLDRYKFWSDKHTSETSEEQFAEALSGLDGELDLRVQGWRRSEQSKARTRLLNGSVNGTCFFCNRFMGAEFLIAAHIKRRAYCNDTEKRDIDNNMILACKFGCDDLFEKGYIAINSSGHALISLKLLDPTALQYASHLLKSFQVSKNQERYFNWHFENRFLTTTPNSV